MQEILVKLGFTETEAHIYLCLTKEGPKKGRDISQALKLYSPQLYRTLKKLQSKGIVNASPEYPTRFSAVPFDKVLDLFIRANMGEAKHLIQNKEKLLSNWRTIIRKDSAGN